MYFFLHQRRNRKNFPRGQSYFSWFFPGVKCFFLVANVHIGRHKTTKQILVVLKSDKQKKKRKKEKKKEKKERKERKKRKRRRSSRKKRFSPHFVTFSPSIFNFPPSLLQFSIFSSQFLPFFSFSLTSSFPVGQQKFPLQKYLGAPAPPPVTPLSCIWQ